MVVVVLVDVVVTNVVVIGWFTMVANGVIFDIFSVTNGVVSDVVKMTDIICIIKHAIFPYVLIVATAACRRSGEAATPTEQR